MKLCANFHSIPFSFTDGMFSWQRELFSTVRTSSSMELLPASLFFLSSAPLCLHFPCSAWLIICSSWSKEACDGLQWLHEFSPLRDIENRLFRLPRHIWRVKLVLHDILKVYLCIVFLKDEKESLGLLAEEGVSSGLTFLLENSLW